MERKQGRRLSAEEKLKLVEEGRRAGVTISEVCRRHQVSHAQFYRWERLARQGSLEALRFGARRASNGKHELVLMNEINCLRAVVTELTVENLTLKKGALV
jgi:transposase-like protein